MVKTRFRSFDTESTYCALFASFPSPAIHVPFACGWDGHSFFVHHMATCVAALFYDSPWLETPTKGSDISRGRSTFCGETLHDQANPALCAGNIWISRWTQQANIFTALTMDRADLNQLRTFTLRRWFQEG
jgi:hypothetical protein